MTETWLARLDELSSVLYAGEIEPAEFASGLEGLLAHVKAGVPFISEEDYELGEVEVEVEE